MRVFCAVCSSVVLTVECRTYEVIPTMMQQFGPRSVSRNETVNIRQYCAPVLPLIVRRLFEMLNFSFSTEVVTAAPAAEIPPAAAGAPPSEVEEGATTWPFLCAGSWFGGNDVVVCAGKDPVLTKRETMMAALASKATTTSLSVSRHCKYDNFRDPRQRLCSYQICQ